MDFRELHILRPHVWLTPLAQLILLGDVKPPQDLSIVGTIMIRTHVFTTFFSLGMINCTCASTYTFNEIADPSQGIYTSTVDGQRHHFLNYLLIFPENPFTLAPNDTVNFNLKTNGTPFNVPAGIFGIQLLPLQLSPFRNDGSGYSFRMWTSVQF